MSRSLPARVLCIIARAHHVLLDRSTSWCSISPSVHFHSFSSFVVAVAALCCGSKRSSCCDAFAPLVPSRMHRRHASIVSLSTPGVARFAANHRQDESNALFERSLSSQVQKAASAVLLSLALTFSLPSGDFGPPQHVSMPSTTIPTACAADYGSLSDEQKAVAEAWRLVDNSFLDRTCNGQDWFKMRQDSVSRKYKNMEQAQDAIAEMGSKLGDKYTRYLSPSKYQSIVDSAMGTLARIAPNPIGNNNRGSNFFRMAR